MILSAQSPSNNPYPKTFRCIDVRSPKDIAEIMMTCVWSPICWKNNQRNSDEFYCSDFLVLDFDDGKFTLDAAIEWAKKYSHIIGTTKSHQKEKSGNPPCDRFRILIPWSQRIEDKNTYLQNMRRITSIMAADTSCKDAARIYQPCTKIVSHGHGERAEVSPYEPPSIPKRNPYYAETKTIPPWLQELMTTTPQNGERNKTAYKISYYLASYGFSEQECLEGVVGIDLPDREKRAAVRSGFINGQKRKAQ